MYSLGVKPMTKVQSLVGRVACTPIWDYLRILKYPIGNVTCNGIRLRIYFAFLRFPSFVLLWR